MELGIIPETTTRTMNIPARARQVPTLSPLLHQEEQLRMLLPIVSALATQAQAREDISRCQGRITEIPIHPGVAIVRIRTNPDPDDYRL